jgi:hypothetical protein
MTKKIHNQYDPVNYACYAVTNIKEDFTLNTVHPSGLQEYLHYDTYDIGNKTLIAFTKLNPFRKDFVYRVVSENYTEEILYENYEDLSDVIEETYDPSNYTFAIMNSHSDYESTITETVEPVDRLRRCDLDDDTFAAVDFYQTNKENALDIVDRKYFDDANLIGWTVYLSSMSNIYIVRLHHTNIVDAAYKQWPARVRICQTFGHAIKMAYEWSILAESPWNSSDLIAQKCKSAFDDWSIPEDAIQEIVEQQPDTILGLFFSGDPNPKKSIKENIEIGPKFKNWFISKLRYRTLGRLLSTYPEELNIPETMLKKEESFFEKEIYNFCVENKLNLKEIDSIKILDMKYTDPEYKEVNNSVTDIVKKYVKMNYKNLDWENLNSLQIRMNTSSHDHTF